MCDCSLAVCGKAKKHNITDLLDSLLGGYNKHLRPDFGGKRHSYIYAQTNDPTLRFMRRKAPFAVGAQFLDDASQHKKPFDAICSPFLHVSCGHVASHVNVVILPVGSSSDQIPFAVSTCK